LFSIYIGQKE